MDDPHTLATQHLCVHDPRSDMFLDLHAYDDQEDIPAPRDGCSCDRCFYGRDRLALAILKLLEPQSESAT